MAEAIKSVTSLTLDLPPSCIAFCPTYPRLFVVGTYYLHPREDQETSQSQAREPTAAFKADADSNINDNEDGESNNEYNQDGPSVTDPIPQKRSGSLILFDLDPETSQVTPLQTLPISSAVLDIQWRPNTDLPILATATSTGSIHFHALLPCSSSGLAELQHQSTHQATETTAELCLYFSWHPLRHNIFGATFNNGTAKLYSISSPSNPTSRDKLTIQHMASLPSHSLEAWVLSFSPPPTGDDATSVYTGGDDGALLVSSLPLSTETSSPDNSPIDLPSRITDRKSHQAGITAILPLPSSIASPTALNDRELVLTGSYDDHIRLLSLPAPGQTGRIQVLAELNLEGGVWRLNFLSWAVSEAGSVEMVILASCMHAGARIVRLGKQGEEGGWEFEVLAKFEEHRSMNYGSDVQPIEGTEMAQVKTRRKKTIVSTSFYDKLLCVWDVDV